MVQKFQFQDKVQQQLDAVRTTMTVLVDVAHDLADETYDSTGLPRIEDDTQVMEEWVNHVIKDCSLGEMRERFVQGMLLKPDKSKLSLTEHVAGLDEDDVEMFDDFSADTTGASSKNEFDDDNIELF